MLAYSPKYFNLAPLYRRVYETARAFVGEGEAVAIPLAGLHGATGSQLELRRFKYEIMKLAEGEGRVRLPDYELAVTTEDALQALAEGDQEAGVGRRARLESWLVVFWIRRKDKESLPDLLRGRHRIRRISVESLPRRMRVDG
jgi:hypothetical protein